MDSDMGVDGLDDDDEEDDDEDEEEEDEDEEDDERDDEFPLPMKFGISLGLLRAAMDGERDMWEPCIFRAGLDGEDTEGEDDDDDTDS